ncbi:MAG: PIN domain-containing protein [Planctomycetes bacterium]|nr:PIN domain-containing protein [Planctomycetota bacterium]
MIAVDTNILVYAHREDARWHRAADRVVAALAEGKSPWAIPWPCLWEFVAITTHPRIYDPPTPLKDALTQIRCWQASPSLVLLAEDGDFGGTLESLLLPAQLQGGAVHDGRVAALCLHHGVSRLLSADRDFGRFPRLEVVNPLISR